MKELTITSPVFSKLQNDFNTAITELIRVMEQKKATGGSLTLKLAFEINHKPKEMQDGSYEKDDSGETIMYSYPRIEHKISSKIQIEGGSKYEGKVPGNPELWWDNDLGVFVLNDDDDQTTMF